VVPRSYRGMSYCLEGRSSAGHHSRTPRPSSRHRCDCIGRPTPFAVGGDLGDGGGPLPMPADRPRTASLGRFENALSLLSSQRWTDRHVGT